MDWIEQISHLSPDHGDGTLEALILIASLAPPIAWAVLKAASAAGKQVHLRVSVSRLRLRKNAGGNHIPQTN